jgi:hypothetical protein
MKNIETSLTDLKKIFDIKKEPMPHGAWWWWFWLFFFSNPKNPEKPQQLMILWSTKNAGDIDCNNLKFKLIPRLENDDIQGVVASWYFDGEKMQHPLLIEQCNIKISDNQLLTNSTIPTLFTVNKNKSIIRIGDDFELIAEIDNKHNFTKPVYQSNNYVGSKGYSMIRLVRAKLKGKVKNKTIHGTAFFHRIFMNAPTPSWYWGMFHFKNGGILTYFNPYLFGKSLKRDVTFFDGKETHEFIDINVSKVEKSLPIFTISGESEYEKIKFIVNSYSRSLWTLRKNYFGIIPNKLIYNEYPAFVSDFKLTNKKTGKNIILKDIGKSVGNAEHAIGFLL